MVLISHYHHIVIIIITVLLVVGHARAPCEHTAPVICMDIAMMASDLV